MRFSLDFDKFFSSDLSLRSVLIFMAAFALGMIVLSFLVRLLFGKHSGLNHAICSALGILMVYAVSVVIYTFRPGNLSAFLSPLPFVTFSGDRLILFSFLNSSISEICAQLLSMFILAFLVNLIDDIMTSGKGMIGWLLCRFINVVLAMAAHYLILRLFERILPGVLVGYAPMILLGILLFLLTLGLLKVILGLLLIAVNPLFAAVYTFLFSNLIGKQLVKAVFSTIILSVFVIILEHIGCIVIPISSAALISFIPVTCGLVLLWYLIGHVL